MENLVKQVLEGEALDPAIILRIKKLSKVAVKAIADTIIQSLINKELLMQLKRRKEKEALLLLSPLLGLRIRKLYLFLKLAVEEQSKKEYF